MFVVADIGGTKTRIAASADLETFGEPVIFDTEHEYKKGLRLFIDNVKSLTGGQPIERMCVALPGTPCVDHLCSFISGAGTLTDWSNKTIVKDLEAALGTKVRLENDTALVGLGEAVSGAGSGADIIVYVTVSTGVGGARIVDGSIDRVARGSEMGGQYLTALPLRSLEDLVSGTAVRKKYGKHPKELGMDSPVWEELAETLAVGLYNSLLHWSPNRVVIGGSMLNEIGISVDRVAYHIKKINVKLPVVPEIVHSSLGDVGGLWGGLARLKQLRA